MAKVQIFTLHFSKIRAFGARHLLKAWGFKQFTEEEKISYLKKDTAYEYHRQKLAKISPAKGAQFDSTVEVIF